MKRLNASLRSSLFLLFISVTTLSKSQTGRTQTIIIEPYPLTITLNKTTNLIFPYAIKSVDRGSADVLVQKAKGVENILLVKAGRENFSETNLSVITADEKLYSFLLNYKNNPPAINISFISDTATVEVSSSLRPVYNEAAFHLDAERLLTEKKKIHGLRNRKYQVKFSLNGIYIKDNVIFLKLEVVNKSSIGYEVDMLRFFIMDKRKSKRTASQEIEIKPLYVHGSISNIKGEGKSLMVYALPKFTIPNRKYLLVQLMEKNGGRNLNLHVNNRTIIKARSLKEK